MQYILSQEEYDELTEERVHLISLEKKQLQKLCTKIANEMPVKWGWGNVKPKDDIPEPWGCIITRAEETSGNEDDWACDMCPVKSICPYEYQVTSK